MTDPVFLFGFERSGTTLLTMMVGAHPRISCPLSVTGVWWEFARKLDSYNHLESPADIQRLVDDIAAHERLRLWKVPFDTEQLASSIEPGRYDQVVQAFHAAAAEAEGKARWTNMDIATLSELETVAQLFPNAKFVQIVRDGRDVAISFRKYRYGGLNAMEIADRWSRATIAADRIGEALGPQRYYRIRYEDLILTPSKVLGEFCTFIGETYDPMMLEYGAAVAEKVPDDKRSLWPVLDRPPQTDKVDRWRREMAASEGYVFGEGANDALSRFGYETQAGGFSPLGELRGIWCWLTRGARLRRLRRGNGSS